MRKSKNEANLLTAKEVQQILGISESEFYTYVKNEVLHRVIPVGKRYGMYMRKEVEHIQQDIQKAGKVLQEAEQEGPLRDNDAIFTYATLGDMDALYRMAIKIKAFRRTADGERRRSWMRVEPRGHYIMKRVNDGEVVAYFYLLSLKEHRLEDYLHGQMPSRKIGPDDIEPFKIGEPTKACVIGGIGSDPEVGDELRSSYVAMLLRGVRQDLGYMGSSGIIIPRLYAFSETSEGITMCARLGMEQWEPPEGKRCTFYLDMETSHSRIIRAYQRGLAQWRESHPETTVRLGHAETAVGPPSKEKTYHPSSIRIPRDFQTYLSTFASPDELPPGSLSFHDWITRHNITRHRRKILDYIQRWNLEHEAFPTNRAGESARYLTPDQQTHLLEWIQIHHPDLLV